MNGFQTELRSYRVLTPLTVAGSLHLQEGNYLGVVEWTVSEGLGGMVENKRRYILRLGRRGYAQAGGTDELQSFDVDVTGEVLDDEIEVIGGR